MIGVKQSIKKYSIVILITFIFIVVGYGVSLLEKTQWKSEAQIFQPTTNELGNYYALASMYQFIQGKVLSEEHLTQKVYEEFKRQLTSYDNIRRFWQQTPYYKQKETGNIQADRILLEELVKAVKFSTALRGTADSLTLQLDNPKQAFEMLNAFIAYTNLSARQVIYSELIGEWKTLFNQVDSAAQLNLGSLLQGDAIGIQDWQGKLKMMRAVSPLDNNLIAYRYLKTPSQPLQSEPFSLFWIFIGGLVGILVGIITVKVIENRKRKFK
ncbi:LPS chain length-determining protein [Avibacterium paragallinarum]|nr:LPS chain length-determining protein [Avibacterium paragallinarum]